MAEILSVITAVNIVQSGKVPKAADLMSIGISTEKNPAIWQNYPVWNAILETGKLNRSQLLQVAEQMTYTDLYIIIVQTGKLRVPDMIKLGLKLNDEKLWSIIYQQLRK